jgi:hypothetical protein
MYMCKHVNVGAHPNATSSKNETMLHSFCCFTTIHYTMSLNEEPCLEHCLEHCCELRGVLFVGMRLCRSANTRTSSKSW